MYFVRAVGAAARVRGFWCNGSKERLFTILEANTKWEYLIEEIALPEPDEEPEVSPQDLGDAGCEAVLFRRRRIGHI